MHRHRLWIVLAIVVLACLPGFVVDAARPKIETVDDLIQSREKRRKQLERVLESTQRKLKDHRAGKKTLNPRKLERIQSKAEAYQEQIQELGRELTAEEIQELLNEAKKQADATRNEL